MLFKDTIIATFRKFNHSGTNGMHVPRRQMRTSQVRKWLSRNTGKPMSVERSFKRLVRRGHIKDIKPVEKSFTKNSDRSYLSCGSQGGGPIKGEEFNSFLSYHTGENLHLHKLASMTSIRPYTLKLLTFNQLLSSHKTIDALLDLDLKNATLKKAKHDISKSAAAAGRDCCNLYDPRTSYDSGWAVNTRFHKVKLLFKDGHQSVMRGLVIGWIDNLRWAEYGGTGQNWICFLDTGKNLWGLLLKRNYYRFDDNAKEIVGDPGLLSGIASKYAKDSWPLEVSFHATFADSINDGGVVSLGPLASMQQQLRGKKAAPGCKDFVLDFQSPPDMVRWQADFVLTKQTKHKDVL